MKSVVGCSLIRRRRIFESLELVQRAIESARFLHLVDVEEDEDCCPGRELLNPLSASLLPTEAFVDGVAAGYCAARLFSQLL
jgi:hypothetical protein